MSGLKVSESFWALRQRCWCKLEWCFKIVCAHIPLFYFNARVQLKHSQPGGVQTEGMKTDLRATQFGNLHTGMTDILRRFLLSSSGEQISFCANGNRTGQWQRSRQPVILGLLRGHVVWELGLELEMRRLEHWLNYWAKLETSNTKWN